MKTRLILFSALLLVCTGAGFAQGTPDLMPPALETVCDAETGAAYGLCNAYCEAMDCETDAPSASATACDKVRTKFENVTGRDVPCEEAICPCTSIPVFNATLAGANFCYENSTPAVAVSIEPFNPLGPYAVTNPYSCGYFHLFGTSIILPITPAQATVCFQVLYDAIASRGLPCGSAS